MPDTTRAASTTTQRPTPFCATDIDEETWWDLDFRVVEVFNDSSFAENKQNDGRIYPGDPAKTSSEIGTVDDWFGLLNSDERDGMFVVGSSDSHTIMRGSPVGYPRTCVIVGTDDPEDASRRRRPAADDEGPREERPRGDQRRHLHSRPAAQARARTTRSTGAGPYEIELEVQAPLWVGNVELIEMWTSTNKVITSSTIAVGSDPEIDNDSVQRFSESVPVPAGVDWVVFHARGAYDPTIEDREDQPQTLDPVHPGRLPFGVTNPIFFAP